MKNFILLGGPGSGKGKLAEMLSNSYNLTCLSSGTIVREKINLKTDYGIDINTYVEKGELIPDSWMMKEMFRYAMSIPILNGVVFDGFPRTLTQAKVLDKILDKKRTSINTAIYLVVPHNELVRRISIRAKSSQRIDDNEDTILRRLEIFEEQIQQLCSYYSNQRKLLSVQAEGNTNDVFNEVVKQLKISN